MSDNTAILQLVDGNGSVRDSLQLKVDNITHSIGRTPVVFSIPAVQEPAGTGIPLVFALDFGQLTENIILSGVLPDYSPDAGSNPIFPSQAQLSHAVRTWWRYSFESSDFSIINGNILRLEEGPGHGLQVYRVLIQNLQATRVGGKMTWTYKLTLAVVDFPERIAS